MQAVGGGGGSKDTGLHGGCGQDGIDSMGDDLHDHHGGRDETAAAGKVSEAFEWLERARGRLYDFHQMLGHLDLQMSEAVQMLRETGHAELADVIDAEVVGRNVLDGRWTFQVIEEFDDIYYEPIRAIEKRVRDELVGGRRHVHEAEMKERRRSRGLVGHEARPPAAHHPQVATGVKHEPDGR